MKKAIFPGSFDPIHKGHISIIKKASKIFDELVVVITYNQEKKSNLTFEKRLEFVEKAIEGIQNVNVEINKSLKTADFAKKNNAKWIVRSARNDFDFSYELELAAGAKYFNQEIETILIIPDYKDINFASRLIKQTQKN